MFPLISPPPFLDWHIALDNDNFPPHGSVKRELFWRFLLILNPFFFFPSFSSKSHLDFRFQAICVSIILGDWVYFRKHWTRNKYSTNKSIIQHQFIKQLVGTLYKWEKQMRTNETQSDESFCLFVLVYWWLYNICNIYKYIAKQKKLFFYFRGIWFKLELHFYLFLFMLLEEFEWVKLELHFCSWLQEQLWAVLRVSLFRSLK